MIIDACMFFNEVEMLELRLNVLNDTVSQFVIVESLERFGSPLRKEPIFFNNKERFKKFEHKINYVVLSQLFPRYTDVASGWQREKHQREALYHESKMWAMQHAINHDPMNDILICSDVDEIPNPEVLQQNLDKIYKSIHRLDLDFFYYNVNSYVGKWPWGTTVGPMSEYEKCGGSHQARSNGYHETKRVIADAGWHFSYFGGVDKIKDKVKSFSHSKDQIAIDLFSRTDADLKADMKDRRDLYRRPEMNQFEHRRADDPRLPKYFLENRDKFPHFVEE